MLDWQPVSPVALIFYLRMRIEELAGKARANRLARRIRDGRCAVTVAAGDAVQRSDQLLVAAAIGAPLFAIWVITTIGACCAVCSLSKAGRRREVT